MSEKLNIRGSFSPMIGIVLSVLIFLLMLAPVYAEDYHTKTNVKDSYNIYEFFKLENSTYVGNAIPDIYDGKEEIKNIEFKKKTLEYLEKSYDELLKDDTTERGDLLEVKSDIKQLKMQVFIYGISIALFTLNTLLLVFAILGFVFSSFNIIKDEKGEAIAVDVVKYLAYVMIFGIFLSACVLIASINGVNFIMQQVEYIDGLVFTIRAVGPIALLFFTLFPLIGFAFSDVYFALTDKKREKVETVEEEEEQEDVKEEEKVEMPEVKEDIKEDEVKQPDMIDEE